MRNRDVIAILIVVLLFVAGAVFLTESNNKKHHTDPAFPDNSLEFIQMDVETGRIKCAMFTGYITDVERIDDKTPGACEVMLGIFHYSLFSLFEDFERFYNGRWWSFGTEVKENEE